MAERTSILKRSPRPPVAYKFSLSPPLPINNPEIKLKTKRLNNKPHATRFAFTPPWHNVRGACRLLKIKFSLLLLVLLLVLASSLATYPRVRTRSRGWRRGSAAAARAKNRYRHDSRERRCCTPPTYEIAVYRKNCTHTVPFFFFFILSFIRGKCFAWADECLDGWIINPLFLHRDFFGPTRVIDLAFVQSAFKQHVVWGYV